MTDKQLREIAKGLDRRIFYTPYESECLRSEEECKQIDESTITFLKGSTINAFFVDTRLHGLSLRQVRKIKARKVWDAIITANSLPVPAVVNEWRLKGKTTFREWLYDKDSRLPRIVSLGDWIHTELSTDKYLVLSPWFGENLNEIAEVALLISKKTQMPIVTLFNGTPVWVSDNIKTNACFFVLWENEEQRRYEEYKQTREYVATKGTENICQVRQTQNFRS